MRLGAFITARGHHVAAWRRPDVAEAADVNFPRMVEVAQLAERGLFDMLFSADVVGATQDDPEDRSDEVVMIIKPRAALAEPVRAAVKEMHSYTTHAILVSAIESVDPDYQAWL